jgi:peptidoglycan-associated lipoprotein
MPRSARGGEEAFLSKTFASVILAPLLLLAACGGSASSDDAEGVRTVPSPRAIGQRAEVGSVTPPDLFADIFFDYDKAEIRADQKEKLARSAEMLRTHPAMRIRIEGHVEERYDPKYALALSERFAMAVKVYLEKLGVDGARMETVGYGKERPFRRGHDEAAWAQNRRAHFIVIAE